MQPQSVAILETSFWTCSSTVFVLYGVHRSVYRDLTCSADVEDAGLPESWEKVATKVYPRINVLFDVYLFLDRYTSRCVVKFDDESKGHLGLKP